MTRLSGHGPRRTLLRCALPISVLAALATPSSAGAAPAFLSTETVSPEIVASCPIGCIPTVLPDVALDDDGNTIVAWSAPDGGARKIVYRYRPAGGSFGAEQTVAPALPGFGTTPQVAFDDAGNATFAWIDSGAALGTVRVVTATRSPDGTISTPAPASSDSPFVQQFVLAVGSGGDAVIAWTDGGNLMAATRAGGGAFDTAGPVASSSPGTAVASLPGADVDDDGNVVVVWNEVNGGDQYVYGAYKPVGSSFPTTADELDSGTSPYFTTDVDFDGAGNATAAWTDGFVSPTGKIETSEKPKSAASFGNPVPVVTGESPGPVTLAVADDGRALVAYTRAQPPTTPGGLPSAPAVEIATRPAGGSFGTPQPVGGTSGSFGVTAVVGRNGKGLLLTSAIVGASQVRDISVTGIGAALKDLPAGAGLGATPHAIAVDDDGNGAIASNTLTTSGGGACFPIPMPGCGGSGTENVNVTGFDGAGPRLRSLQSPGDGLAGAALPFSVDPVDVWSSVTSTSWAFGDSGTANSAAAQHTYGSPGDYTATVTSTDSLGNTSTASRAVKVGSPVPAGGATPPPTTPQGPVTPSDAIKPVLSSLSMTRRTFGIAAGATPVSAAAKKKTPKGSAFRFSLSEVAKVKIVIERKTVGRRSGSKCVKATRRNAKARKCTLYVKQGELSRSGRVNGNNVPFTGRIGRKALKVGSYRATLVATDAAGNASQSKSVAFKIAK